MSLRRQPIKPPASSVRSVGLDAQELRRRIAAHLRQHARAGETAMVDVEEVVIDEQSGDMTVTHEQLATSPRAVRKIPRPNPPLVGEAVWGLPVDWYMHLTWLPAVIFAAVKIVAMIVNGRSAALSSSWWTLPLVVLAGAVVGWLAAREQISLGQVIVSGVTMGALAGVIVALFRFLWTWKLIAILNLIVEPAYFALAAAIGAVIGYYIIRRWLLKN